MLLKLLYPLVSLLIYLSFCVLGDVWAWETVIIFTILLLSFPSFPLSKSQAWTELDMPATRKSLVRFLSSLQASSVCWYWLAAFYRSLNCSCWLQAALSSVQHALTHLIYNYCTPEAPATGSALASSMPCSRHMRNVRYLYFTYCSYCTKVHCNMNESAMQTFASILFASMSVRVD